MAEIKQGSQGSAFISYSRKDKAFVRKLNDALDNAGVQAWVDWEGIELASDWMQTITNAIQTHNAFIFVISPDSLKSKVCMDELELGLKFNKKLIPVLYIAPEKRQKMHKQLSATNWVYMRKEDNFKLTIPKLIDAIQTDLEWVSKHTQLLNQATEWEDKNKNNSFLLQGTQLEEAEKWTADAADKENRGILPIQAEFIRTSRGAADRRHRIALIGISTALIVSIALSVWALFAQNTAKKAEALAIKNQYAAATAQVAAEENQKKAEISQGIAEEKTIQANASKSAAQSQILQTRAGELDASTLLAIESYNVRQTFQAENLIRINTSLLAIPVSQTSQSGAIWNIEWSPDYQYFVTGNNLDSAKENAISEACVYQADNGQKVYCVQHDNDVNDAIFSKDGKILITASADKSVKFWNAEDGSLLNELDFNGAALDLDVSESVVAIAREDNFLTLYYLNKPDLKPINAEQPDGVKTVEFSPNGDFLAFGLQNGQVRFWQARNNFFYKGPEHKKSSYVVLAWSPDSNWLLSGGGDSLAKITKRDGTFQYNVTHEDWVEGVAFGKDPSWFVTVSDDNKVRVINRTTNVELFRMSHTHFAQKVIVSSDGEWIASTGYDNVVRIWDSVAGIQIMEIPLEAHGSAIAFNQDASRLIAADEDGNISIWDISQLKIRSGYIEFKQFVREARFTPDGKSLIVNADDYNVWKLPADQINQITDGTDGKIILSTNSLTYNSAVSPDSQWVAVVELDTEDGQKNRGTLVSIDGRTQLPLEHGGEVTAVAFTNDNKLVATSGADGLIWFWDIQYGKKQFNLNNSETIHSMAVNPISSLIAAGLHDKIKVWDLSTKQQITELHQSGDIVTATFNQDGTILATGSSENTVILWKVDGNIFSQIGDAINTNGYPRMLAFNPNGKWLAGGGSSGFAYLWNTESMQELARISHGKNPVTSVSFSPDGSQLLTVSRKVVRIWDISAIPLTPKDKLVDFACSHLVTNFSANEWSSYFEDQPYNLTCPSLKPKQD